MNSLDVSDLPVKEVYLPVLRFRVLEVHRDRGDAAGTYHESAWERTHFFGKTYWPDARPKRIEESLTEIQSAKSFAGPGHHHGQYLDAASP